MTEKQKFPPNCLTGNALKCIAVFTMLIDHIGALIVEKGILCSYDIDRMMAILETESGIRWYLFDIVLRSIGRLAFPIFCFLLVEGFLHTRNEMKYAGNLLLFAFISEIPFDLAFFDTPFFMGAQNVYFTLFFGVTMMHFLKKQESNSWMQAVIVAVACVCAFLFKCDYMHWGILMIASFYLFRNMRFRQFLTAGIAAAISSLTLFGTAVLSLLPIACYNGRRGRLRAKYFFYIFYPMHIILLILLRYFLFGII